MSANRPGRGLCALQRSGGAADGRTHLAVRHGACTECRLSDGVADQGLGAAVLSSGGGVGVPGVRRRLPVVVANRQSTALSSNAGTRFIYGCSKPRFRRTKEGTLASATPCCLINALHAAAQPTRGGAEHDAQLFHLLGLRGRHHAPVRVPFVVHEAPDQDRGNAPAPWESAGGAAC